MVETEEKLIYKEEEEQNATINDEEKKPEEKVEDESEVGKLLDNMRKLLAEFNETVNEFTRALQGVEKRLDNVEKALVEMNKKLITVEEVSAKREQERYAKPKEPVVPAKEGFGGTLDVTPEDFRRIQPGQYLEGFAKGKVAETPRPEAVVKGDVADIVEKIYKGEASLEDIAKMEKMIGKKINVI